MYSCSRAWEWLLWIRFLKSKNLEFHRVLQCGSNFCHSQGLAFWPDLTLKLEMSSHEELTLLLQRLEGFACDSAESCCSDLNKKKNNPQVLQRQQGLIFLNIKAFVKYNIYSAMVIPLIKLQCWKFYKIKCTWHYWISCGF